MEQGCQVGPIGAQLGPNFCPRPLLGPKKHWAPFRAPKKFSWATYWPHGGDCAWCGNRFDFIYKAEIKSTIKTLFLMDNFISALSKANQHSNILRFR